MSEAGISNFLFYRSGDGNTTVRVIAVDETVWMTQKSMGQLFGAESNTITYHLQEIFKSGELKDISVTRKFRVTADDGKNYLTNFYNLDAIIAVGYRVNSYNATQFRIWATKILKEYLIKGFAMDDERLKQGKTLFGKDYFDELLVRIREIRASEEDSIKRSQTFIKSAALITIPSLQLHKSFSKLFRINSSSLLRI